jgi:hypothetical protein
MPISTELKELILKTISKNATFAVICKLWGNIYKNVYIFIEFCYVPGNLYT